MERIRYWLPHPGTEVDGDKSDRLEATAWEKLINLPAILVSTAFSVALAVAAAREWHTTGPLYHFSTQNRATTQILVQVLASLLGATQILAVCSLLYMSTSLKLRQKPTELDRLRFWAALRRRSFEWDLPAKLLPFLLFFLLLAQFPAALWAGAITPVSTAALESSTVRIPQYTGRSKELWNRTCLDCWARPVASPNNTDFGLFSYHPSFDMQGSLLGTASSASGRTSEKVRHPKIDNSGFFYIGRSYGVGAAAGLGDQDLSGSNVYAYNEFGYNSKVACLINETSAWKLTRQFDFNDWTYPSVYLASGFLPNSAPEAREFYSVSSLNDNLTIVALVGTANDNRFMYAFATGFGYLFLDKVQCEVNFEPTRLQVVVDVRNKTISVMPSPDQIMGAAYDIKDIDPSGSLKKMVFRQPTTMSMIDTTLYTSLLGNVFRNNYGNLLDREGFDSAFDQGSRVEPGPKQNLLLTAVAESLESILDNSLLALANAQIAIASDTTEVPASSRVPAVQIGDSRYTYAVLAINAAILVLYALMGLSTKLWKGLTKFDYTDIKCALVGASAGGDELGKRVGIWDGDPADGKVGAVRVDLRYDEMIGGMVVACAGQQDRSTKGKMYTILNTEEFNDG